MPKNPDIQMKLKRADAPAEHVGFDDFAAFCNAIRQSVSNVRRCVGASDLVYQVENLEIGSALVGIQARRSAGFNISAALDVHRTFSRTLKAIENDSDIDERLDYAAIKSFSGFAVVIKKGNAIECSNTTITSRFSTHLATLLETESPALGSVSGKLERVDIHSSKNTFSLFTSAHGERVDCVFNESDLPEVAKALKKQVTVYGKLYYSRRKIFPVRVEVSSFEVHPKNSLLSSLLEIRSKPPTESSNSNV